MAKKKKKVSKEILIFEGIFVLLVGILIGAVGQDYFSEPELIPVEVENNYTISGQNVGIIKVPAIDNEGNGVSTELIVMAEQGSGRTLVDIDNLLFWVDTQNSIRMAKLVSEEVTGLDLNQYDLTFSIGANASLIGGESAGAALALASIIALKDLEVKDNVMITGTTNHDGSIGPVGGILNKANAAKEVGTTLFLVPLLQSREVVYESIEHCENFGLMEWCTTEKIPRKIDIAAEAELEVVEVGSISEALEYFIVEE